MFNRFNFLFKLWRIALVTGLAAILVGCMGEGQVEPLDSGVDGEDKAASTSSKYAFFEDSEQKVAVQVLTDATDSTKWVYFDLDNFTIVNPEDPENDVTWDVAFKRFVIKVNGGVSGIGGVEVATFKNTSFAEAQSWSGVVPAEAEFFSDRSFEELPHDELLILGNNPFFFVCKYPWDDITDPGTFCINFETGEVEYDKLSDEEAAYVFLTKGSGHSINQDGSDGGGILGWYDYYFHEFHLLRPAADVHLIKTSDGNMVIFEMVGYYGYEEGDEPSGTVTFRFSAFDDDFIIPQPGNQPLVVSVSNVTMGTAPLPVLFSTNVENIDGAAKYEWDFNNDGNIDSTLANPIYTFTDAGIYNVTLTVTDDRGADFSVLKTTSVKVDQGVPDIELKADAGNDMYFTVGNDGVVINLDASGTQTKDGTTIVSYDWTSSNPGYDPDNVENPTVQILEAGIFSFILTVTDSEGATSTDEVQYTVVIHGEPIADASVNNSDTLFSGNVLSFVGSDAAPDADSSSTYFWEFGDGGVSTDKNPSHTYSTPGIYSVSFSVTNSLAKSNTFNFEVVVKQRSEVVQDVAFYEFIGNLSGKDTDDDGYVDVWDGDTYGLGVWNHETDHGGQSLIDFGTEAFEVAQNLGSGNFKVTMWLYATCGPTSHVGGCVGQPENLNPTFTTSDVNLFATTWDHTDSNVSIDWYSGSYGSEENGGWANVPDNSAVHVSFTQDGSEYTDSFGLNSYGFELIGGWVQVDVTALYESMVAEGNGNYTFLLTQEHYNVVRNGDSDFPSDPINGVNRNGALATSFFCDSESSEEENGICHKGDFRPYLVVEPK